MRERLRRDDTIELDWIDLLLLTVIGILLLVCLSMLFPLLWSWCVVVFNVRKWSRWMWISLGGVLLVVLVLLRARQEP
jgi:hypothetical protein